MKNIYLIFILITGLCTQNIIAQSTHWQWLHEARGPMLSEGWAVATDPSSNVYIAGEFTGDSFALGNTILRSTSPEVICLVKLNSSGTILWARNEKQTSAVNAMTTDINGNVLVTGNPYEDSMVLDNVVLRNLSPDRGFIVKYDSMGHVLWASAAAAGKGNVFNAIASDKIGNIYVTGLFTGDSVILGSYTLYHPPGGNARGFCGFIVKYSPGGVVEWAYPLNAVDSGSVQGTAITVDNAGNFYFAGEFQGDSINLGGSTFHAHNRFQNSLFIAKCDSNGNVIWVNGIGGSGTGGFGSMAYDAGNNIYVTGQVVDTLKFGIHTITSNGGGFFLAQYDLAGTVGWIKTGNSTGYTAPTAGYCVATDTKGTIYVTGTFSGYFTVDTTTIYQPANAFDPMFFASFDRSGKVLCAEGFPSGGDDQSGVCVDRSGNVYIGGDYYHEDTTRTIDSFTTTSYETLFIGRYNCTAATGIYDESVKTAITVYPNPSAGSFYFSGVREGNTIEIYNLLGQAIYTANADRDNYPVNLSRQKTGVYFYKVMDQGNVIQQGKIVVE